MIPQTTTRSGEFLSKFFEGFRAARVIAGDMNSSGFSCFRLVVISAALLVEASILAQQGPADRRAAPAANAKAGRLVPVTEKDAARAAEARKDYPLAVCLTSDEKLGSMGRSPEYFYQVEGQPDRLVVFCCSGCEEDFLKDSAKYLAKIDAAKNGQASRDGQAPAGHARHQ